MERAALSFHVRDYETAVKEISAAIDRRPLVPEYYEERELYRRFVRDVRGAQADRARAERLRAAQDVSLEEIEALGKDDRDDQPIAVPQNSPSVLSARARLAATWKMVAREVEGRQEDTSERDCAIRFQGDRYLLVLDGKVQQDATYMLDAAHEPRWIDCTASIRDKAVTLLGIYEFHGDTLVIAMANAGERRPKRIATEGPDSLVIDTLQRRDEPAR